MNTLFSMLKADIVNPLIAPPVPSKPAENPDNPPPIIEFLFVGLITNCFRMRKSKLSAIKKIPKMISSQILLAIFDNSPPTITNPTEGKPM